MALCVLLLQCIFVFYFVKYEPIKYAKTYHYPWWGEALGFAISGSSVIFVPAYAIYFLLKTPGSLREKLRLGITPVIKPRKEAAIAQAKKHLEDQKRRAEAGQDVEMSLVNNEDTANHV